MENVTTPQEPKKGDGIKFYIMETESTTPQEPKKGGGILAVISFGVAIYLIYLAGSTLF